MSKGSLNDPALRKSTFPAVTPEDLDGETLLGVTIADAEIVDFGNGDKAVVLTYEEIEGKKHRINSTGRKRLMEGTGSEELAALVGRKISLEVTKQPNPSQGGAISKVVWVAESQDWPQERKRPAAKKRKK